MRVGLVPYGTLTKKVLILNRKLVGAPIDKVRRRVGGPHAHEVVLSRAAWVRELNTTVTVCPGSFHNMVYPGLYHDGLRLL